MACWCLLQDLTVLSTTSRLHNVWEGVGKCAWGSTRGEGHKLCWACITHMKHTTLNDFCWCEAKERVQGQRGGGGRGQGQDEGREAFIKKRFIAWGKTEPGSGEGRGWGEGCECRLRVVADRGRGH